MRRELVWIPGHHLPCRAAELPYDLPSDLPSELTTPYDLPSDLPSELTTRSDVLAVDAAALPPKVFPMGDSDDDGDKLRLGHCGYVHVCDVLGTPDHGGTFACSCGGCGAMGAHHGALGARRSTPTDRSRSRSVSSARGWSVLQGFVTGRAAPRCGEIGGVLWARAAPHGRTCAAAARDLGADLGGCMRTPDGAHQRSSRIVPPSGRRPVGRRSGPAR